jgi:hypothetical protein
VDERTLNFIFVSVTSFFLTVMPVLIALMPLMPWRTCTAKVVCNMTTSEREAAHSLLWSCPSNATVADIVGA